MEKSRKFLTNPGYGKILEIIGLSDEPLSIGEIVNTMERYADSINKNKRMGNWKKKTNKKKKSAKKKYIYKMVEELIPIRENRILLFSLDRIWQNNMIDELYVSKVIRKLNSIFFLKWPIRGQSWSYYDSDIDFVRNELSLSFNQHGNIFSIYNETDKKGIAIEFHSKYKAATLYLFARNENGGRVENRKQFTLIRQPYPLEVNKKIVKIRGENQVRYYLYIDMHNMQTPIKYLYASDKRDTKNDILEKARETRDSINYARRIKGFPEKAEFPCGYDISNNTKDRGSWKFRLNIRGLLLYVLLQSESENKENGRAHDVRISNMLKNLSENYVEDFPFLLYYHDSNFRQGFDILSEHGRLPENFHVRLIKDIAQELRNVLKETTVDDLSYRVTKRFYDLLEYNFREGIVPYHDLLLAGPVIPHSVLKEDFYRKIIFYLSTISKYLRDKQKEELFKIENDVKRYVKEYSHICK